MLELKTIVTGGQTGVDRGALDAALANRFPCGGWCPHGRIAEDGLIPPRYPVRELETGGYEERTLQNVVDSDGTLIIYFGHLSGGTELTQVCCVQRGKPYQLIDAREVSIARAAALALQFIDSHDISVLNVAGPRESDWEGAGEYTARVLDEVIQDVRKHTRRGD